MILVNLESIHKTRSLIDIFSAVCHELVEMIGCECDYIIYKIDLTVDAFKHETMVEV
jgi:hypothetical protein